jgi:glycosyltransferase involved in cell wall biosynthesis
MRMLFISHEPWYGDIVTELRKDHVVDYVFKGPGFRIQNGDIRIPALFGIHRAFSLIACLIVHCLLPGRRYDVCLTDYKSPYFPALFLLLPRFAGGRGTRYIYDMRTVPVDYDDARQAVCERSFSRKVSFANRYFDGISVITGEMKKYIEEKYAPFIKPVGIWESGVDTGKFTVTERDQALRRSFGFRDDDFVCFYHGSMGLKRGVVELAEAFAVLSRKNRNIKLFALGSGKCCGKVREIIEQKGLGDQVKLHGQVAPDAVPRFISMADLCVIPLADIDWWRVSSPLKLMEYIACGKNILLSRMVAHLNVVGGECGYSWVDRITAESLAEGIESCYRRHEADPAGYRNNGLQERARLVNGISWGCRARSLSEFITAVVGGP